MKTLTCAMLGGPENCVIEITGITFAEMGQNSKTHVMEMINSGDDSHKESMENMMSITAQDQMLMIAEYQKKFNEALSV